MTDTCKYIQMLNAAKYTRTAQKIPTVQSACRFFIGFVRISLDPPRLASATVLLPLSLCFYWESFLLLSKLFAIILNIFAKHGKGFCSFVCLFFFLFFYTFSLRCWFFFLVLSLFSLSFLGKWKKKKINFIDINSSTPRLSLFHDRFTLRVDFLL